MPYNSPFRRIPRKEISITFMSGPYDGKKLTFAQPEPGQERVLKIGRREGSDIHLSFDSQVSRTHALLGCVSQPTTQSDASEDSHILTFWLRDNDSRNGTFVDKQDERIDNRVSLRPGTLFRIGKTWLRLDIPLSFD